VVISCSVNLKIALTLCIINVLAWRRSRRRIGFVASVYISLPQEISVMAKRSNALSSTTRPTELTK